jgi:predicted nucleotidyltransferase
MINLSELKPEIERVCRTLPVKRLGLFGSALTADFSSDSDIDVLVVFDSDMKVDLFEKYFDLKEQLTKIFNRNIDLIIDKPFRNPIFRESVDRTRTIVYER